MYTNGTDRVKLKNAAKPNILPIDSAVSVDPNSILLFTDEPSPCENCLHLSCQNKQLKTLMNEQENKYAQLKVSYENACKVLRIERESSGTKIKLLEQANTNLSEKLSMKQMESAALQKNLEELRRMYKTQKNVI